MAKEINLLGFNVVRTLGIGNYGKFFVFEKLIFFVLL
jgi:hypothetical protein